MNQRQEVFLPLRKLLYRHLVDPRCSGILPHLLPCLLQTSRLKDLHQHFSHFSLAFAVIYLDTEDYRTGGGLLAGTGQPV
jgi:hypothetical protein